MFLLSKTFYLLAKIFCELMNLVSKMCFNIICNTKNLTSHFFIQLFKATISYFIQQLLILMDIFYIISLNNTLTSISA
jgi:hypothetical protein